MTGPPTGDEPVTTEDQAMSAVRAAREAWEPEGRGGLPKPR
jgi:hypothetical protein